MLYNRFALVLQKYFAVLRKKIHSFARLFFVLFGLYFICCLSLFRANYNYLDDISRSAEGYAGWDNFSRYTSNFLSSFIHANSVLSDISPLTQIIALLLLVAASVLLIYKITGQKNLSFAIAAVLPLGLSPYFLECISYKFDSPYMALSILAGVFPALFLYKNPLGLFISSFLCTLIVCTTYQAATGIFPMLLFLLCFQAWNLGDSLRRIWKPLIFSLAGYLGGLLYFKFFVMAPLSDDSYVSSSLLPIRELIPGAFAHYKSVISVIHSDFRPLWLYLILFLCLAFVVVSVIQSRQNKFFSFLISLAVVLIMFLLSFGLYPFLTVFPTYPRALYGFGVFIAMVAVYDVSRPRTVLSKAAALALSWCFIAFTFLYGNALSVQKEYSRFRTVEVIDDLKDLDLFQSEEPVVFDITGASLMAPQLETSFSQYGILSRLVHSTFDPGSWSWSHREFQTIYGIPNLGAYQDLSNEDLPLLKENFYHAIYGKDNMLRIVLK